MDYNYNPFDDRVVIPGKGKELDHDGDTRDWRQFPEIGPSVDIRQPEKEAPKIPQPLIDRTKLPPLPSIRIDVPVGEARAAIKDVLYS